MGHKYSKSKPPSYTEVLQETNKNAFILKSESEQILENAINKIAIAIFNYCLLGNDITNKIKKTLDKQWYLINSINILSISSIINSLIIHKNNYYLYHNIYYYVNNNKIYIDIQEYYTENFKIELAFIESNNIDINIIINKACELFKNSDYYKNNFSKYPFIIKNGNIYLLPNKKK